MHQLLESLQQARLPTCELPASQGGMEANRESLPRSLTYFTSPDDRPAKSSTHPGKIPSTNVPIAGRINASRSPADSGSTFSVASLGSCIYIITRIRR